MPVSGMTCAACQGRVQRALTQAPGVSDVAVNLTMNNATVTYDPSATTPASLIERIHTAGYEATLPDPTQDAFAAEKARDRVQSEEFRTLKLKAIGSGIVAGIASILSIPLINASTPRPPQFLPHPFIPRSTLYPSP